MAHQSRTWHSSGPLPRPSVQFPLMHFNFLWHVTNHKTTVATCDAIQVTRLVTVTCDTSNKNDSTTAVLPGRSSASPWKLKRLCNCCGKLCGDSEHLVICNAVRGNAKLEVFTVPPHSRWIPGGIHVISMWIPSISYGIVWLRAQPFWRMLPYSFHMETPWNLNIPWNISLESRWNEHGIHHNSFHGFHIIPDGFHIISHGFHIILNGFHGFHIIPDGFHIILNGFHVIPHYSTWIPYYSRWIPHYFTWIPHYSRWIPHHSRWIPYYSTWIPHYSRWIPHYSTWTPHYFRWIPYYFIFCDF